MVGALLDFPALLEDSRVHAELELLEGESARIVAAISKCMRINARGEKVMDTADFLAQMSPLIQAFASARLAAPAHETLEEAFATVAANSKKLRETNVAQETRVTVREQQRHVGDWEAEVELLKHVNALVQERQGVNRR